MKRWPWLYVLFCLIISYRAWGSYDVTTSEARKANLIDYIKGRQDLSPKAQAEWDKALRIQFGGKAIKDGTDEGVTVAKSVIAAAIFYQIPPAKGVKAAYEAYHDTYRNVPPPISVN